MQAFRHLILFLALYGCLVFSATSIPASETSEGIGASTNGIHATGKYSPDYPGGGDFISISIHFASPSTIVEYVSPFESRKYHIAKYFCATNSFIGFVELKNAKGDKIPVLKPWLNSAAAYPDSYSLQQARLFLINNIGMGPELPFAITGSDPEIGNFYLKDLFLIEKPGVYQLTVLPKIYKKTQTNDDIVQRIDLPPVTIPINWTEPTHKFSMTVQLKNETVEITTNGPAELLVHCQNNSSNETFIIYNVFPIRFDETWSFAVTSPTGEDISPKLPRMFGGSSRRDFLLPGKVEDYTVDLRDVLKFIKFDKAGVYQIIARKRILTEGGFNTFASNPFIITVHQTSSSVK
jgi:hypothetical protein